MFIFFKRVLEFIVKWAKYNFKDSSLNFICIYFHSIKEKTKLFLAKTWILVLPFFSINFRKMISKSSNKFVYIYKKNNIFI